MHNASEGVTVIVPTLNRGSYLIDTLQDLVAQDYRPLEILVVDQSVENDSAVRALVASHPGLISYHRVPFRGLPLARNYGWQHARYEAIIFVDDDIRCGPALVAEHMRSLRSPGTGAVAGGIDEAKPRRKTVSHPGRFNFWTATPSRGFEAAGECTVTHVPGGNFSVWRKVLQQVGGFDEALAIGAALYEEAEFSLRVREAGYTIRFNGSARLTHLAAGSGGCRMPDIPQYVGAMAHNRAIMIRRHLKWFQRATAVLRVLLYLTSYAFHYREAGVFHAGMSGFVAGLRDAKQPPVCSEYKAVVQA